MIIHMLVLYKGLFIPDYSIECVPHSDMDGAREFHIQFILDPSFRLMVFI